MSCHLCYLTAEYCTSVAFTPNRGVLVPIGCVTMCGIVGGVTVRGAPCAGCVYKQYFFNLSLEDKKHIVPIALRYQQSDLVHRVGDVSTAVAQGSAG